MAQAIICDGCGKAFKAPKRGETLETTRVTVLIDLTPAVSGDLCRKCFSEFKNSTDFHNWRAEETAPEQ